MFAFLIITLFKPDILLPVVAWIEGKIMLL